MTKTTRKTLDTMTRNRSGIRCALVQTAEGYLIESRIGCVRRVNGPMTREAAGSLWERLQTVGTPAWRG